MHKLEEIRDNLMDELIECSKEELSKNSLDVIDKLTHSIKSIDTILAMAGYSKNNSYDYSNGRSYDNSYRRDSMGRYARRYSRDDDVRRRLEDIKQDADEETRHMIDEWLKQVR